MGPQDSSIQADGNRPQLLHYSAILSARRKEGEEEPTKEEGEMDNREWLAYCGDGWLL